ncbi:uncharacterized protein RHIMIDRAFT_270199 [Rhizopus microsporus ATCC 52813]|uniref:Uncharacterized protein n=1 Tax=Rhizopus microsporus ATCC 52813 TaxID=1340429 RepID=A0A2G4SHE2_RHIZD|nr:uncharacterized protein RHIMIDRAFT_270199 [Rhizopus microsporus ATCC 52813]PHZ08197.1 hypothetical protein RHIMIDRAFT_270199 [Rhizopus microsporus ATCC 52813]
MGYLFSSSSKISLGRFVEPSLDLSRRSGFPTAPNTWKKNLITWPWPWARKRLKESFEPDTNNPSLEI